MKLKEGFILRQVAGTWVVLATGADTIDFNGMIKLNDTGAMLWNLLAEGTDREAMAEALTAKFDVSMEQALADVDVFYNKLVQAGCTER